MAQETCELVKRARRAWDVIRDYQAGRDFEEDELRSAFVTLRDSILALPLRLGVEVLRVKPDATSLLTSLTDWAQKIRAGLDACLFFLDTFSDAKERRRFVVYALGNAPPIESYLTIAEGITKALKA